MGHHTGPQISGERMHVRTKCERELTHAMRLHRSSPPTFSGFAPCFAGSVADAFTLFEKLEERLERYPGNLPRAVVELAKDWRTDRYLRRLETALAVADRGYLFLVSGEGHVVEPDDDIVAIGSGGGYALAAARALKANSQLGAPEIARTALEITADICIYTNHNISVLELEP